MDIRCGSVNGRGRVTAEGIISSETAVTVALGVGATAAVAVALTIEAVVVVAVDLGFPGRRNALHLLLWRQSM